MPAGYYTLFTFLAFLISGCRSSLPKSELETEPYRRVAVERFGPAAEFIFNEGRTHVICVRRTKPTTTHPQATLDFFVWEISTKVIIHEQHVPDGSVKWLDDVHLQVDMIPGIVQGNDSASSADHGYTFNVRTGEILRRGRQRQGQ